MGKYLVTDMDGKLASVIHAESESKALEVWSKRHKRESAIGKANRLDAERQRGKSRLPGTEQPEKKAEQFKATKGGKGGGKVNEE